MTTYQKVVAAWNAQADEHNQWDALGEDEKIEWAVACAKAAPPAVVEPLEPCPACIALARTVMLDQVSFDRKPDCYGIRQITGDEGIEEWEDIRTSPDVAREEANDMMATGRGEIYEVVPLWTTPQPTQAQARAVPPGKMLVERAKLAAIYIDLGKLQARIDAMGMPAQDTPPHWWQQQSISF